jgi:hypothetical protein
MTTQTQTSIIMVPAETKEANNFLVDYLQESLQEGKADFVKLQSKLTITYFVVLVLSILMFLLGIVLLSVPFLAAFRGEIGELKSLISAGFGIADLTALFFFKPIERIHNMMGDFSQIMVAIHSYQTQTALRLLESNIDDRSTIGKSASYVQEAAQNSVAMIQNTSNWRRPEIDPRCITPFSNEMIKWWALTLREGVKVRSMKDLLVIPGILIQFFELSRL